MKRTFISIAALLSLVGCQTYNEHRAASTALKYLNFSFQEPAKAYEYVCLDDKEVKSQEEFLKESKSGQNLLKELLGANWKSNLKLTIETAEVQQDTATFQIRVQEDQEPFEVKLEKQNSWCVSTGWKEDEIIKESLKQISDLTTQALNHFNEWQLNESEASLNQAKAQYENLRESFEAIPKRFGSYESLEEFLTSLQTLIDTRKKDWLGGRWMFNSETNPVSQSIRAVASLEAIESNLGDTSLILRCQEGRLEAYITTDKILNSDWRTDRVYFRHRFEDAQTQSAAGSISTSHNSVFFYRVPNWLQTFKEQDGKRWFVELPVYRTTPQSATFDLTASTKAVDLILEACPSK